jgi:colicin import membrane protein
MNKTIRAALAAVAVVSFTAGCELPEEDISSGKHAFSEKGNGKQAKKDAPKQEKAESGPQLTAGQENAIESAQDYLDYSAFSKTGLVKQLKFEGYTDKDATFAVNHIKVNWNEQAAKSAADYLDYSSFSRQGLIDQLEFEGYSEEQATYGATQAGL